jgi:hypothetical protein
MGRMDWVDMDLTCVLRKSIQVSAVGTSKPDRILAPAATLLGCDDFKGQMLLWRCGLR